MHMFNRLRVGHDQVIVASIGALPAKMLSGEVLFLQVGSHRAVKDDDLFLQYIKICLIRVFSGHIHSYPHASINKKPLSREVGWSCFALSSFRIPSAGLGT